MASPRRGEGESSARGRRVLGAGKASPRRGQEGVVRRRASRRVRPVAVPATWAIAARAGSVRIEDSTISRTRNAGIELTADNTNLSVLVNRVEIDNHVTLFIAFSKKRGDTLVFTYKVRLYLAILVSLFIIMIIVYPHRLRWCWC